MFGLLYHKQNPLITTVVYKATFLKHLRLLGEKQKILFLLGHYNNEIIINTKTKAFCITLHRK